MYFGTSVSEEPLLSSPSGLRANLAMDTAGTFETAAHISEDYNLRV